MAQHGWQYRGNKHHPASTRRIVSTAPRRHACRSTLDGTEADTATLTAWMTAAAAAVPSAAEVMDRNPLLSTPAVRLACSLCAVSNASAATCRRLLHRARSVLVRAQSGAPVRRSDAASLAAAACLEGSQDAAVRAEAAEVMERTLCDVRSFAFDPPSLSGQLPPLLLRLHTENRGASAFAFAWSSIEVSNVADLPTSELAVFGELVGGLMRCPRPCGTAEDNSAVLALENAVQSCVQSLSGSMQQWDSFLDGRREHTLELARACSALLALVAALRFPASLDPLVQNAEAKDVSSVTASTVLQSSVEALRVAISPGVYLEQRRDVVLPFAALARAAATVLCGCAETVLAVAPEANPVGEPGKRNESARSSFSPSAAPAAAPASALRESAAGVARDVVELATQRVLSDDELLQVPTAIAFPLAHCVACLSPLEPSLVRRAAEFAHAFVLAMYRAGEETGEACDVLCSILERVQGSHPNVVYDIVHSLSTRLFYGIHESEARSEVAEFGLDVLGRIAAVVENEQAGDVVQSSFMECLHAPGKALRRAAVRALGEIALHDRGSFHHTAVDRLIDMYSHQISAKSSSASAEVQGALLRLAQELRPPELRAALRRRVIRLATAAGMEIQTYVASYAQLQLHSVAGHLGALIPVVAAALKDAPWASASAPASPSSAAASGGLDRERSFNKLEQIAPEKFRLFWFYCVLFRFVDRELWPPEWTLPLVDAAAHTPPLVASRPDNFLKAELELEALLTKGLRNSDLVSLRTRLANAVPAAAAVVASVKFSHCVYLLSVLHLESLRVESEPFEKMFVYLEDQGIESRDLASAMQAVSDIVFETYVRLLATGVARAEVRRQARDQALALAVRACHRSARIRDAAAAYLLELGRRLPFLLWNRGVVSGLLNLVDVVSHASEDIQVTRTRSRAEIMALPVRIELPESLAARRTIRDTLIALVREFIGRAAASAPQRVQSLLHEYASEFESSHHGMLRHAGYALASTLGCCSMASSLPTGTPWSAAAAAGAAGAEWSAATAGGAAGSGATGTGAGGGGSGGAGDLDDVEVAAAFSPRPPALTVPAASAGTSAGAGAGVAAAGAAARRLTAGDASPLAAHNPGSAATRHSLRGVPSWRTGLAVAAADAAETASAHSGLSARVGGTVGHSHRHAGHRGSGSPLLHAASGYGSMFGDTMHSAHAGGLAQSQLHAAPMSSAASTAGSLGQGSVASTASAGSTGTSGLSLSARLAALRSNKSGSAKRKLRVAEHVCHPDDVRAPSFFVNALVTKANALGEVRGLRVAYAEHTGTARGFADQLAESICADISDAEDDLRAASTGSSSRILSAAALRGGDAALDSSGSRYGAGEARDSDGSQEEALARLKRSLMLGAALLAMEGDFASPVLLEHIVWAPARVFSAEALELAVPVWTWICAARPDLALRTVLLTTEAWEWTRARRLGIFSRGGTSGTTAPAYSAAMSQHGAQQSAMSPQRVPSSSKAPATNGQGGHAPPPLTARAAAAAAAAAAARSFDAHGLWVTFYTEVFETARYDSVECVRAIVGVVERTLSVPGALSVHPAALAVRFRLGLLALRVLHGRLIVDEAAEALLRSRVYAAALGWFEAPPTPQEMRSLAAVRENVVVLEEFARAIQRDADRLGRRNAATKMTGQRANVEAQHALIPCRRVAVGALQIARRSSSSMAVDLGLQLGAVSPASSARHSLLMRASERANHSPHDDGFDSDDALSTVSSGSRRSSIVSALLQRSLAPRPGAARAGDRAALASLSASAGHCELPAQQFMYAHDFIHLTSLLLLLVSSEVDRLVTWDNPLKDAAAGLARTLRLSADRPLPESQWRALASAAWDVAPALAVQLPVRLVHATKLRDAVAELVVAHPEAVADIADAVDMVATAAAASAAVAAGAGASERTGGSARPAATSSAPATNDSARARVDALRFLLYWAPTTPARALALLHRDFLGNALITQYALQTLQRFAPETIAFYLPQLVQSLRHSRGAVVEAFLSRAAQRSEHLAHMLLWHIATEVGEDTEPAFAARLCRLRDSVIASFDDGALARYEALFGFYGDITAISGDLVPLDSAERRAVLRERLRGVSVPRSAKGGSIAYLPTEPEFVVTAVHPDDAACMQSAAKCPIMVPFTLVPSPAYAASAPAVVVEPPTSPAAALSSASAMARRARSHSMTSLPSDAPSPRPARQRPSVWLAKQVSHTRLSADSSEEENAAAAEAAADATAEASAEAEAAASAIVDSGAESASPAVAPAPAASSTPAAAVRARTASAAAIATAKQIRRALIFKMNDDCRQDALALQIIALFKNTFDAAGLELYLYPYKVITTGDCCGIIQMVPNTKSRDQLGKITEGSLYDYFISKYGDPSSAGFHNAQRNFIMSMAAYSVVSYILQIKDRHNGNILVDDDGHIIHIDFGFIFDISPGGDIKFEGAPFKLSREMIDIMGGDVSAEPFRWYMTLCVKAFLTARRHMHSVIALVSMVLDSQLPCFKGQTLRRLRERFVPDLSDARAAQYMIQKINESFAKVTTLLYDQYQAWANQIEY